jgi:hypothetical protein
VERLLRFPRVQRAQHIPVPGLPTLLRCARAAADERRGNSTAARSSVALSSEVNAPTRNCLAGTRRSPACPRMTIVASMAAMVETQSAAGSACARLPPTVPRFLTARYAMLRATYRKSPREKSSTAPSSISACVRVAPIEHDLESARTARSSGTWRISTNVPGRASRRFSIGPSD